MESTTTKELRTTWDQNLNKGRAVITIQIRNGQFDHLYISAGAYASTTIDAIDGHNLDTIKDLHNQLGNLIAEAEKELSHG